MATCWFPTSDQLSSDWWELKVWVKVVKCWLSALLQIAPAEGADPKLRKVIISGPPEAQFKVLYLFTATNTQHSDGRYKRMELRSRIWRWQLQCLSKVSLQPVQKCIFCLFAYFLERKKSNLQNAAWVICTSTCPTAGSVSSLWQAEGREFLRTQGRGEAGGSYQGSFICCWTSHREGRQNGKRGLINHCASSTSSGQNVVTLSTLSLFQQMKCTVSTCGPLIKLSLFILVSFVVTAGKRAAELDLCRSGGAQGPDARREWPGYSEDQRTLLCLSGGFLPGQ